ncbi:hypothetical protein VP1G_07957 [Cytospora mali]|uniref:Uncharacterized protein n=1 Tax=Cytospora mali TaxID=578113 RepID=A0A194V9X2_CYTMA|nr:hypothetical protein VP1G_07957 [Valsa mali var. pyri (nom. inval.)]
MAPLPIESEVSKSSLTGLAVVVLHVQSVIYFTWAVGKSLTHSYKSLSPSQDVRLRMDRRRKLVPLFAGLALLSLGTALYSAVKYTALSYHVWADERGYLPLGNTNSAVGGILRDSLANASETARLNVTQLAAYKIRWLADTPIYQDAFEIVAEKARRYWWGQQIDLSIVPWSALLAIEGTRRGIPNLFAFLCLAHLVNLSFAQNLFYVALLLTPAPLPSLEQQRTGWTRIHDAVFPPKPRNWCLSPGFFLLSSMASYGSIFLLPYAAETANFGRFVGITRACNFVPLFLQKAAPVSWGAIHSSPHKAQAAFTDLFRLMSFMSVSLHSMATFAGLRYNLPDSHYHRHSRFLPWDIEKRSKWDRTTTAVGRILGSMLDHPVVAAVGYDVLLSGTSVGLWAAVRSLGAGDILTSVVPLYNDSRNSVIEKSSDESSRLAASESARRSGRNKGVSSVNSTSHDSEDHPEPPTNRRRGRPRKAKPGPKQEPGDETYMPSPEEKASAEGDALPNSELDLEAAALAWGLMAVGGLGLGSAGVFGGECLA